MKLVTGIIIIILCSCLKRETILEAPKEFEVSIDASVLQLIDSTDFSVFSSSFFFDDRTRKSCRAEIQSGILRADLSNSTPSLQKQLQPPVDTALLCFTINIQAMSANGYLFMVFTESEGTNGISFNLQNDSIIISSVTCGYAQNIKTIPAYSFLRSWVYVTYYSSPDTFSIKLTINEQTINFSGIHPIVGQGKESVDIFCSSGSTLLYLDNIILYKK
jgi:hypothetical protein